MGDTVQHKVSRTIEEKKKHIYLCTFWKWERKIDVFNKLFFFCSRTYIRHTRLSVRRGWRRASKSWRRRRRSWRPAGDAKRAYSDVPRTRMVCDEWRREKLSSGGPERELPCVLAAAVDDYMTGRWLRAVRIIIRVPPRTPTPADGRPYRRRMPVHVTPANPSLGTRLLSHTLAVRGNIAYDDAAAGWKTDEIINPYTPPPRV